MNKPAPRILVVDDELKNRRLLEVLLKHEGYDTVSAASGDEALALIEQQAPDLILLDVMMPALDGYQVTRILKAHPLSLHIPIILVSALCDSTARLAGLNAGAEDFLTKPFHRDELRLRIRNLLRLKSVGDEVRDTSVLLEERVLARTIDLQRFRTAMDATDDVLAIVDRSTMRYIEVNAASCRLCGYTREELLTMGPAQLFTAEAGEMEREFDAIIAGAAPSGTRESLLRRKDGSQVHVELNRQALRTPEGWTIVAVGRDITERKEAEARLQQLAHYDPLTHLPNRRLFQESLSKAIEQADALDLQAVLLYLDVDNFKDINDSLGHAVGDELLRGIGERLLTTMYARDSVGRLGGDEFGIILMTPRNPELAISVVQKIHESLRAPFNLSGHSVTTSVSIGITVYPSDTTDVDVLARYADMAMYEAKRSGRNTSRFYTPAMNLRVSEKLALQAALREGLAQGEFVLHYQPKVSLHTGRWTGVEALLRWQRPGHGLVPPGKFIPALEESGLIVAVGTWIVQAACRQLVAWRKLGMAPLPIAINVSAVQIAPEQVLAGSIQPAQSADSSVDTLELLPAIAACLKEHQLDPGLLEVEITESVVMADAEHSIKVLQRLRAMGVSLSVDDFGTGYSSLSYLRQFPLQAVKIDGSFIRDMPTGTEDGSIAIAIIEIAHRLKLKVIAEGVETAEQMQFLQAHECDQAQGYYFARPMPAEALEALWQETGGDLSRLLATPIDPHEDRVLASAWPECETLVASLLAGARETTFAIVEKKLAQGLGMVAINLHLIQPALYCIGEQWRRKEVSVAQEHLATALALSAMAHGLARSTELPPTERKVLLACVQGNLHKVGLQMVADAFILAGWRVNFLGANVPLDALLDHAEQWRPDVLGLSASLPEHVGAIKDISRQLKLAMGDQSPHVLAGGMGFKQFSVAAEQCDEFDWISGPEAAVNAGEALCPVQAGA